MPAPDHPIIQLESLQFRWPRDRHDILDIRNFAVFPGQRVFIKGASGSGKTTLLSLLGGVITPQHGTVSILGTVLNTLSGARRDAFRAAHVGFIFQMFNLIPYLPIVENITLPCRFSPARHKKALLRSPTLEQEALRLLTHLELDVEALAQRAVTELSVGQQQRVAAARALIGSPELVIADEPTSSLDADVRESFLELLFKEVDAAGTTLVFVSHDPSLQSYFDRAVALATINQAKPVN